MKYDDVLAAGLSHIAAVRDFRTLFPQAEHTIVKAKRDMPPEGWQLVHEWISRAALFERYIVWLVVAFELDAADRITILEEPSVSITELELDPDQEVDDSGAAMQVAFIEFEDGDWEKLVAAQGDFAAIELELKTDAVVEQFAMFWRETRPTPLAEPPTDGMAFKAPLRFLM